jgi:ankyrin repeat protein
MECDVCLIRQNQISQHGSTRMTSTVDGHLSYSLRILLTSNLTHSLRGPKFPSSGEDDAPLCLYYAALCGFRDLTKQLITMYPQHVNARVGLNKKSAGSSIAQKTLSNCGVITPARCGPTHWLRRSHSTARCISRRICGCRTMVAKYWRRCECGRRRPQDSTPLCSGERTHGNSSNLTGPRCRCQLECPVSYAQQYSIARSIRRRTRRHHATVDRAHGGCQRTKSTPSDALASCVEQGDAEAAQLLLKHGADVCARNQGQSTPLHLTWDGETAQILIMHGADVHARDQSQATPLHRASSTWNAGTVVQLLITHGADVHARDESLSTPLHLASSKWNVETSSAIDHARADVNAQDQSQSTPLHLASLNGNADTVQLLIKHGADVHARDQSQSTPLHIASSMWDAETVQLLIDHGADIHARDQSQSTPLHISLLNGNVDTAQLLIKHGADVHARDQSQSTPLHLASLNGNVDTVQLLIKHGADVHARDQSQSTPLHIASSMWDAETVQLLLEHGADIQHGIKASRRPCISRHQRRIIKLFSC